MLFKAPGWKGADVRERSNVLVLAKKQTHLVEKIWNQFKEFTGNPVFFP